MDTAAGAKGRLTETRSNRPFLLPFCRFLEPRLQHGAPENLSSLIAIRPAPYYKDSSHDRNQP
jgi:hypothetical protein